MLVKFGLNATLLPSRTACCTLLTAGEAAVVYIYGAAHDLHGQQQQRAHVLCSMIVVARVTMLWQHGLSSAVLQNSSCCCCSPKKTLCMLLR